MIDMSPEHKKILQRFEQESGLTGLEADVFHTPTGAVLSIKVAHPTERLFRILEDTRESVLGSSDESHLVTLTRHPGGNLLKRPEGQTLLRTLSESLNINRYSFAVDFRSRYTRSVFGAESQVSSSANHVVYGRRGAGKSMLLLYALHDREQSGNPYIWIDMQVYAQRTDDGVIADLVRVILEEAAAILKEPDKHHALIKQLNGVKVSEAQVRKMLPQIRRFLSQIGSRNQELFVFLDDFHVVGIEIQPTILDVLNGLSRGNRIHLKLSAIETLTRTFDAGRKVGLEIPHDAQVIKLDYNLTIPERATEHIDTILNSQAQYSGLPSVRRLCTSSDVVPRLTWVAAESAAGCVVLVLAGHDESIISWPDTGVCI